MANKDSLGDRMKEYERSSGMILPRRIPLIVRIDGHGFSKMTKKWKSKKPFDVNLIEAMSETTKYLCDNIQGCVFAYTQSDEISLVILDDQTIHTTPYFGKKVQKITSITAAKATKYFNYIFKGRKSCNISQHAEFDSRAFIVPKEEVVNSLIWRQQDWTRNSVQMLARSLYSHKECNHKNNPQLQDMIYEKGLNWNDCATNEKRGICVVKVPMTINTPNGDVIRNKWVIDMNIPIFTKDREYIEQHLINKEKEEENEDK